MTFDRLPSSSAINKPMLSKIYHLDKLSFLMQYYGYMKLFVLIYLIPQQLPYYLIHGHKLTPKMNSIRELLDNQLSNYVTISFLLKLFVY